MGFAPSFTLLLTGLIIAGIGVGYSLMISPLYTAEIFPAKKRGFLTSLPEVFIVSGILLGYIVNYSLSGLLQNINWRLMLGLAAIPAFAIGFGVAAMPEPPRWLVMKGQATISSSNSNWRCQGVWRELLLSNSPGRRILIAAIGINFFMQASGNDAVIYYCPEVFKDAGIHNKRAFWCQCDHGSSQSFFCVDFSSLFRQVWEMASSVARLNCEFGMALSLAVLGMGSTFLQHSETKPLWAIIVCIMAVCANISFFSIGLGPMIWVDSSEIFPLRLRAQGPGLAISVNKLVSWVQTQIC
ncbi:hypothetical protein REPUB_Repub18cG0092400 [Reevesia pubescens]